MQQRGTAGRALPQSRASRDTGDGSGVLVRGGAATMQTLRLFLGAVAVCCACAPSYAAEGSSVAGPIGGTDIRAAQLPPPGLYGGLVLLYARANQFFDGSGKLVPALSGLDLTRMRAGPFLLYVPDVQVLGGS